jgi:cell division septation protein DedD
MHPDLRPQEEYFEPDTTPRRRLRAPVLVVLVMAASAGGVWIAYTNGHDRPPGEVPLIQADPGLVKKRPPQPGGMAIPNQDKLVYTQEKAPPQVERLLPPPETPLPRPAPPPEAEALPPPSAPSVSAAVDEGAAAPPASPAPAPAAATSPAPSTIGGYRLQLGAFRSREAARQEWDKIRKVNGDLLGDLAAVWPRADLGDRGVYYRVQTTTIADAATAERLCGELKRRKVACIVVRP